MNKPKFRAWDRDDKVMRNWEDLILLKEKGDNFYMIGYEENNIITSYDHEQILMQYTGLKDKNGVEIYEGDVVKVIEVHELFGNTEISEYTSEVKFEDYGFVVDESEDVQVPLICLDNKNEWVGSDIEVEVIGNIHETPELLSGVE